MKKKLFLLPITLTTLAPMMSMVGCKNTDEPKVVTHTVTFSAGEHGSLKGETTVTVEGDKTTLGEITKPKVIEDEGWDFDHWDYDDSYVIKNDVTITALYNPGEVELTNREIFGQNVYFHSNELNFPSGTTFSFSIDFSNWGSALPFWLGFCHRDKETISESSIEFSLNEMYMNGTLIDEQEYSDIGTRINFIYDLSRAIFDERPIISGEITLEQDIDGDMLCFVEFRD